MGFWQRFFLFGALLYALAAPAGAASDGIPAHRIVSEDVSEHRRLVNVRIDRRLKEAELMRLGEAIRERQARPFARTIVNLFLPGQDTQQGPWGSVSFTTESKVVINGLRQEDEDVLTAEFAADKRHMLGSWLTSPPAAPGRFTIFSDEGRIRGEWRLRNGQRTVDDLIDVSSRNERRFEVVGGSTYVLTRSGDLEIREKTVLVAVAERIRAGAATPPPVPPVASRVPPEPAAPVTSSSSEPARTKLVMPAPAGGYEPLAAEAAPKPRPKSRVAARPKEPKSQSARSAGDSTPGDQINAKLGRI